MPRRTVMFVLLAVVLAAVCVRLGFWQLRRLEERRTANRLVRSRLSTPSVPLEAVTGAPGAGRFRRVTMRGTFDYTHELTVSLRTREGSPGVHLITPLLLEPGGAVLVNRGWVYSPDGQTVDHTRWRESAGDTVLITGYLEELATDVRGAVTSSTRARSVRRLVRDSVRAMFPYPVGDYYVVALEAERESQDSTPARLTLPSLDEGPHLSYALQWFAFAVIAALGIVAVVLNDRRQGTSANHPRR